MTDSDALMTIQQAEHLLRLALAAVTETRFTKRLRFNLRDALAHTEVATRALSNHLAAQAADSLTRALQHTCDKRI